MATSILRPNGTVSNPGPWTVTVAATAHEAIDDAVTQPTAATTTDNVTTSTSGRVLTLDLDASPSDVGNVTAATIWMYASSAGNDRITAGLFQSGGTQIGTTGFSATNLGAYAWYSFSITGLALSKTIIDGARLVLTSLNNGAMSAVTCAAAYVEITYDVTRTGSGAYYTAVTALSGLAGYWRLDEASGTLAKDYSGNYREGTTTGATVNQTGLIGGGDSNTAYTFDGTDDAVVTAAYAAFNTGGTTAFSMGFIYRTTSLPATDDTFIGVDAGYIYYTSGGKFAAARTGTGAVGTTTVATNTTYRVVMTYSGTQIKLYVNGVLEVTFGDTGSLGSSNRAFAIGRYAGGGFFAPGTHDEVWFATSALTQTDVDALETAWAGTIALASTITGASTVTAAASVAATLAGNATGTSAVTANIASSQTLASAITGSSTVTANITTLYPLATTITGASSVTADATQSQALAATMSGAAAVTANIDAGATVAVAITGASAITGNVSTAAILATTMAGASTVTADTGAGATLAATVAGSSALAGDVSEAATLATDMAGSSEITANATAQTADGLNADVAGASTVTADIAEAATLATTSTGASVMAADIGAALPLAATMAGASVATAYAVEAAYLATAITSTSTVTASATTGQGVPLDPSILLTGHRPTSAISASRPGSSLNGSRSTIALQSSRPAVALVAHRPTDLED